MVNHLKFLREFSRLSSPIPITVSTNKFTGVERRIADELMGRTKWRELYQETALSSFGSEDSIPMDSKAWQLQLHQSAATAVGDKKPPTTAATNQHHYQPPHTIDEQHPSPSHSSSRRLSDSGGSSVSGGSGSGDGGGDRDQEAAAAMTTLESAVASSMAASIAAALSSSGKPPPGVASLFTQPLLLPPPWYQLAAAEHIAPPPEAVSPQSPVAVPLPPSATAASEQPLDLSAKPAASKSTSPPPAPDGYHAGLLLPPSPGNAASQSLKVPSLSRHIFKAKPRLSAVAGRRTYTEDELQAALRDIQSGKLGTRRAAVLYGIPRSTLRNKVYKLALERDRDSHLPLASSQVELGGRAASLHEDDEDDGGEELSGAEEEREVERALMKPLVTVDDLVRLPDAENSLRGLLQQGGFPLLLPSAAAEPWPGLDRAALVAQLLALQRPPPPPTIPPHDGPEPDFLPKFLQPVPDLFRRMMNVNELEQQSAPPKKEKSFQLNGSRTMTTSVDPGPSSSSSRLSPADDLSGSGTPSPNVILKIPSYRPTSRNGAESSGMVGGGSASSSSILHSAFNMKLATAGDSSQHSIASSPPIGSTRSSESSSPPAGGSLKGGAVTLKDVIAKSISQKFQQPPELHHIPQQPPQHTLDFRRAQELSSHHHHHHIHPAGGIPFISRNHNNNHLDDRKMNMHPGSKCVSTMASNTTTTSTSSSSAAGGKGTRPKRGKYRNYDRDSLVEAVRAVQRGEMSVHRAGSYYGVPHSTLEYKVKERHLMRPRKREPKPTPQDELKRKDESNSVLRMSPGSEKSKPLPPKPPKTTPFSPSSPLSTGPNGMKISPVFDPTPLGYPSPSFSFWNPFHHIPVDYPRGPNFSPSPEHFFASQMIQRLQEDSAAAAAAKKQQSVTTSTPLVQSPPPAGPVLGKSTREIAESLYDGTGTNGSFLDGIIRSSLETGLKAGAAAAAAGCERPPLSSKSLLDQLCRNSSRLAPLVCDPVKSLATPEQHHSDEKSEDQVVEENMSETKMATVTSVNSNVVPTNNDSSLTAVEGEGAVISESACDRLQETVVSRIVVENTALAKEDELRVATAAAAATEPMDTQASDDDDNDDDDDERQES